MTIRFGTVPASLPVLAFLFLTRPAPSAERQVQEAPPIQGIVGGEDVGVGDPVARSTVGVLLPGSLCSGTLIASDVVVTAAHCLESGGEVDVVFGTDISRGRRVPARASAVHPSYGGSENGPDAGDIGVILLDEPAPAGYSPAGVIRDSSGILRGTNVLAAGYGITRPHERSVLAREPMLRKVSLRTNGRYGAKEALLDQRDGSGVCHGDSGGPIYVRDSQGLVFWGVVSRAAPGNPPGDNCDGNIVVSRVDAYDDWVRQAIAELRSGGRDPGRGGNPGWDHGGDEGDSEEDGGWRR